MAGEMKWSQHLPRQQRQVNKPGHIRRNPVTARAAWRDARRPSFVVFCAIPLWWLQVLPDAVRYVQSAARYAESVGGRPVIHAARARRRRISQRWGSVTRLHTADTIESRLSEGGRVERIVSIHLALPSSRRATLRFPFHPQR